MMTDAAIAEVRAGLPRERALALAPLLRIMAHDLNGAMTPLTLEAFVLRDLAARLGDSTDDRLPVDIDVAEIREVLSEAAESLQSTGNRVSAYLADIRRLVDH